MPVRTAIHRNRLVRACVFATVVAAVLAGVVALYMVVSMSPAVFAGAMVAAALALTLFAGRDREPIARDPQTGLPAREDAIRALSSILSEKTAASREGAVIVVALDIEADPADQETRRMVTLLATLRMAQRLRKGDLIMRISETGLAAILRPSPGLTAQSTEGILERLARTFDEPLRIESGTVDARISIGACLQHDAPAADAQSWLEAAEHAAAMAAAEGAPRLFPSGATSIFDEHAGAGTAGADADVWRSIEGRAQTDAEEAEATSQSA